ncbi:nitroreductase/quinone reductase family protein [Modestobacter marinus]|uniref:Glyoxylase-like metal-dependent hydrolase (Beta-lactamase superfamily II) n=1 Tax=Modestobacter marinus TaxID=477641 RepID=A0A846LQU3_9ACTN|nr:nitroreductase/quinone reductase family protein [Modestobacter marinus]NIH69841.1 glyoxylase-like metal-dependent hydrolase (beta-lactamase superfamily II) [Modestobacter marinus]
MPTRVAVTGGPRRVLSPLLRVGGVRLARRVRAEVSTHLARGPGRWPPSADRRGPVLVAPDVHVVTLGSGTPASTVHLVGSGGSWVLVDAGWAGDAGEIRRAAESLFGSGARPSAILLTHVHPDHSGAAGDLARAWRVPVYVHPDELPMAAGRYLAEFDMPLDHWVVLPVMRLLPARTRSRIEAAGDITDVTRPLPPAGVVPGAPDWEWIAAPGHTAGSVAFLRRDDGVLISGDALVTVDLDSASGLLGGRHGLAGPPWYTTWDRQAARRSVAALAALAPRVLLPGHGYPLTAGTAEALRSFACEELDHRPRRDRVLVPVGNPGAGRYRPPPRLYARLQWLGHVLTALGLSPGYVVTLEVPGRRSGVIRRTNLVQARHHGQGYLVSLTGESEWVRNARAAGNQVVLARRGRRRTVTLVEVPLAERAPVIRSYVLRAGRRHDSAAVTREARAFFGVGPDLAVDELATVADRFPVFRVVPGPGDGGRDRASGRRVGVPRRSRGAVR